MGLSTAAFCITNIFILRKNTEKEQLPREASSVTE